MDHKKSANPLVTVIIPTYNEGLTLGVAIQSMIDQTYKNLEIIVVNDGSTDDTEEITKGFAQKDNRVIYLQCPHEDTKRTDFRGINISVGHLARNYAMDKAHGEWITFQDADDASLLNRIETQLQLAQKYNATCVTLSWIKFDEKYLNKKLDWGKYLQDQDISKVIIEPKKITEMAHNIKGPLMNTWFPHSHVPFVFKKRMPTRKLFIKSTAPYPGTDGVPLFRKDTIKNVRFRKRDERVWPAVSGRGVGRDHVFQLAETYRNNYSFKIPMILWRQKNDNPEFKDVEKYLI